MRDRVRDQGRQAQRRCVDEIVAVDDAKIDAPAPAADDRCDRALQIERNAERPGDDRGMRGGSALLGDDGGFFAFGARVWPGFPLATSAGVSVFRSTFLLCT